MQTLNLGILAHVDAGKTSLTERLLHAVGVIDEIGSVDAGSTRTDTLDLERSRGITIRSAVVAFEVLDRAGDPVTINLIDTPGHPDFIAEVERALGVLDAVVLLISAVGGVQAQTRVLMRTLRRLGVPTVLMVNKIDRRGAREAELVAQVRARLSDAVVPLGTTTGLGSPAAAYLPFEVGGAARRETLLDLLTRYDDRLLERYVDDPSGPDEAALSRSLSRLVAAGRVHPLIFGSAITGAGVPELLALLTEVLPCAEEIPTGPPRGTVFKLERAPSGERLAWVRMVSGTLSVRDELPAGRVSGIALAERGGTRPSDVLVGGRIGRVRGLGGARIGDRIGVGPDAAVPPSFPPPVLETVVSPLDEADRAALHAGLTRITEQDPMLGLRVHEHTGELSLAVYGEVQKEVIAATLAAEDGLAVSFAPTTVVCRERVVGTGEWAEGIEDAANPFLAGLGLRVQPGSAGSGVVLDLEVERGSMPPAFFAAVTEGVHALLEQGVHGWEVVDCRVTITATGYYPRQSHSHGTFDKSMSTTAADFRAMAPLVLMTALLQAGTEVLEPVHTFTLEVPDDVVGPVLAAVARVLGSPGPPRTGPGATSYVEGEVPAVAVDTLRRQLPGLTRGEGLLDTRPAGYRPVRSGAVPERRRWDDDPRRRRTYLLAVCPRVGREPT